MKRLLIVVVGTFGALALCLGIWVMWGRYNKITVRDVGMSIAKQRTVENSTCSGACANVTLASDQDPGKVYVENSDYDSCIPVTLWANHMREGQVSVNGYLFDRGAQINLRPITVDTSSGENIVVRMVVADVMPAWYERELSAVFSFSLNDRGDWNVIDAASFRVQNGDGMSVDTEYASGVVSVHDGCAENAKDLVTYVLYQSPEPAWPGSEHTYLVTIVRRGTYGESNHAGDVKIFERIYTQRELEAQSISVEATDGDVAFAFDLVQ